MSTPSAVVKKRPKHLDLARIRMPVPAIVSILHRVSGAAMFLVLIPLLLSSLDQSLASPESFENLRSTLADSVLLRLVVVGLAWAFIHHALAGIRFLLLDLHHGIALQAARFWSKAVLAGAVILTLLVAVAIW